MILLIRIIIFIVSAACGFFAMYLGGHTLEEKGIFFAGVSAVVSLSAFTACAPYKFIEDLRK